MPPENPLDRARPGRAPISAAPDVLTIAEAARRLRIGRNGAYEAARRGELPVMRIGRRLLVPRVALERLLGGDRVDSEERRDQVDMKPTPADDPRRKT